MGKEIFKVNKEIDSSLVKVVDAIKNLAKGYFDRGEGEFKVDVLIPFDLNIDVVMFEIENSTNILMSVDKMRGGGFQYNTSSGKVWKVKIWIED